MTATHGEALPEGDLANAGRALESVPSDGGPANHILAAGGRREVLWWSDFGADGAPAVHPVVEDRNLLDGARVLVVDDCTLYREYLADVICAYGATLAGAAWDLPSLLSAFEIGLPRVVLIDMTTQNSNVLLRQTVHLEPRARVVVTGVAEHDESQILACAEAGVAGYHLRCDSLGGLLETLRRAADGETLCSPAVSALLLRQLSALSAQRPGPGSKTELVLTDRESQILSMLEMGLSNRDIAEQLHIAVHTVKNHVHSLLKKLGVNTRAQAAAMARNMRPTHSDHYGA